MKQAVEVKALGDGSYVVADVVLALGDGELAPDHFNLGRGNFRIESVSGGPRSVRVRIGASDGLGLKAFETTRATTLRPVYGGNLGEIIPIAFLLPGE